MSRNTRDYGKTAAYESGGKVDIQPVFPEGEDEETVRSVGRSLLKTNSDRGMEATPKGESQRRKIELFSKMDAQDAKRISKAVRPDLKDDD